MTYTRDMLDTIEDFAQEEAAYLHDISGTADQVAQIEDEAYIEWINR